MADEAGVRARWLKRRAARARVLAQRVRERRAAQVAERTARRAVGAAERVLARHPVQRQAWHPGATRVRYTSAGAFLVGKAKLVWHTTESSGLPSYSGSAPHFTFDPKTGKLWQHIPIDQAAKALKHPPGTPETNRARAVQVELLAFSDSALARRVGKSERAVANFTDDDYRRIAELARWIEGNAGVPRECTVKFAVPAKRMSGQAFVDYTGHCGHEHVPSNDHWDPAAMKIEKVLA